MPTEIELAAVVMVQVDAGVQTVPLIVVAAVLMTPAVTGIVTPSGFTAPNALDVARGSTDAVINPPPVVSTRVLVPVSP